MVKIFINIQVRSNPHALNTCTFGPGQPGHGLCTRIQLISMRLANIYGLFPRHSRPLESESDSKLQR